MSRTRAILSTVLLQAALIGCAGITAERVSYNDTTTKGFRYWLPKPYLMVSKPVELNSQQTIWRLDGGRLQRVCECEQCSCGPGAVQEDAPESVARGDEIALSGEATGTSSASSTSSAGGSSGAVTLTWLPDYCQMYAVSVRAGLGSNNSTMTLTDGWQLTSLNAELDNTELVKGFVDLAKTFLTAKSAADVARIEATGETPTEEAKPESTKGRAKPVYLVRTHTTTLRPGLYSLISQEGCAQPKLLDAEEFLGLGTDAARVVETTEWTELVLK